MTVDCDIIIFKVFNGLSVHRYFVAIYYNGNFSIVSLFSCNDNLIAVFLVRFILFFFILGMDRNRRYQQGGKNDRL